MDDDTELHPLDILATYAQAGTFIEARLARLKATPGTDPQDIEAAEGISSVLTYGILEAMSAIDEAVTLVKEQAPPRVLS